MINLRQNTHIHDWIKKIFIARVHRTASPLLDSTMTKLIDCFRQEGHTILAQPGDNPGADVILTTAAFSQPVNFRDSLTLTARRRYGITKNPTVFTLVEVQRNDWQNLLSHLDKALAREKPHPDDFAFSGMPRLAYQTLFEQGKRGGPLLAAARIIQAQAMSIRNILLVSEKDQPLFAYTFDLVGAYPRTDFGAGDHHHFTVPYYDLMYRILTAASTHEITQHTIEQPAIPLKVWQQLDTPRSMVAAGRTLGKLGFFTEMVKIANLVDVPLLDHVIASQYSEGCYATWDATLDALICTITGSARPVDKDNLTGDELAVVVGIRPDGQGARIRLVEEKPNDPPSSEAVELAGMDEVLPHINILGKKVPVVRSKLHGHRSVGLYDPQTIEHVYLDPPYYTYPVSCSTEAQAIAIRKAFARSQALQNPNDQRKIVFTILPGHGVLIVEKWVPGMLPFEIICQAIQDGRLKIENEVPQGPIKYSENGAGYFVMIRPYDPS